MQGSMPVRGSTRRSRRTYSTELQKDADGRTLCLECGEPITAERRRTFCSGGCSDAFRVRTNPGFAREKVWERDRGVCALCGLDTVAERRRQFDVDGKRHLLRWRVRSRGTGRLWQADHVVPVAEGGGECGLDNLRTLCTACHLEATRALAARRTAAGGIK